MAQMIDKTTAESLLEALDQVRSRMDNWGQAFPRSIDCDNLTLSMKQLVGVVSHVIRVLATTQTL